MDLGRLFAQNIAHITTAFASHDFVEITCTVLIMQEYIRIKRRSDKMGNTIRARVWRGMLELLEKVDLPEGKEVTITILDVPSNEDQEAFRRSAGKWKGHVDAEALIRDIYADRLISTRPEPRL